MVYTVTFGEPQDVTTQGLDGDEYGFPFSVVESCLIGQPEQKSHTIEHRVIVSMSRNKRIIWRLEGEAQMRVMFEFGKRYVAGLVKSKSLPPPDQYTFRMPMLTTASHPEEVCPFDPDAI